MPSVLPVAFVFEAGFVIYVFWEENQMLKNEHFAEFYFIDSFFKFKRRTKSPWKNLFQFEFETLRVQPFIWNVLTFVHANTRSPSTQSNQFIIMSTAKKENPKVTRAEKELMTAKDELEILKEAKPLSATCGELTEFSEREEEPFSATHVEANAWHKSEGGGCIIL